uniref:Uncharacterized protein n=1 Tax=Angiostrongylus cantonensis TaxID=6313 RepID=A0A0K0DAZ1_ANGCA
MPSWDRIGCGSVAQRAGANLSHLDSFVTRANLARARRKALESVGRPTTNTHFRDGDTDNDTESMLANKRAPPPNGDYRTQTGALRDSHALSAVVFQGISSIAPTTTDLSTQPGVANTYLSCTAYT